MSAQRARWTPNRNARSGVSMGMVPWSSTRADELAHHPGPELRPATDLEVLRQVAAGDKQALGTLYDRHGGVMLALGLRVLGTHREAEDLLHDVFLEAFRHAGDYDGTRGSVKTWLLLRMRSRCLDRRRAARTRRLSPLDAAGEHAAPEHRPEQQSDAARAAGLLSQLPGPQRRVLELGYFEGLSFAEIAEVLSVPIGTVKSRAATAMGKLRELFGVGKEAP